MTQEGEWITMKSKFAVAVAMFSASAAALADQYVCAVNCVSPSGKTQVVVSAGSASAAAQAVDKRSDQVCRSAGYGKSTSASMSSSQCSRK
jgi:hypothetical protein